jgi:phage tail protein X
VATATPTPAQFITHHTTAGERWDLLAWKYYGDATLYAPIIAANWQRIMAGLLSVDAVFNAGVTIGVPILMVSSAPDPADLPPWKR